MNEILQIKNEWDSVFQKIGQSISNSLFLCVLGAMKASSFNSAEIARQMCSINNQSFNTNDVKLRRLLYNEKFQIDDTSWRCYFNLLFGILEEKDYIQTEQIIPINVDFTTVEDKFLILFASIPFAGRSLPLYFSMRNYPKKAGQLDQKRMENAFLKELRKLLSRKYKYVIIADRGFGNTRWMSECKKLEFNYLVRARGDWKIEIKSEKITYLSDLKKCNYSYREAILVNSKFKTRLVTSYEGESEGWYLLTNLDNIEFRDIVKLYSDRFKIEKLFQDFKSQGFDIEKSKIQKYSNFKRMLFITVIAKALMLFIGDWIEDNGDEIKKKYPLHINLISAFSSLLEKPVQYTGTK